MEAKDLNKQNAEVKIDQTAKVPNKGIMEAGLKLAKVFTKTGESQRKATLESAKLLQDKGEDDVNSFLAAFREGIATSSASAISSKVKAVILAYRVESYEHITKVDPKTSEVTKETKSGKEWLEQFKGTFEAMVTFARKIRGATEGQGSGGGKQKTKLSTKDMERVEENLKLATKDQCGETIARAVDQLQAIMPKAWEPVVIGEIGGLVARLAKSGDLVFQKLAQEIDGLLNDHHEMRRQITAQVNAPVGKPVSLDFTNTEAKGPDVPLAAAA